MKKLILLFFSINILAFSSNAQCVPDPLYFDSIYGAWPDTVTNFVPGQVGVAYTQILDFKLPTDAGDIDPQYAGLGITIDSAVLISVSGLPPGLSYACNTSTCSWLGGSQGCAAITGTPTTAGTYDIVITLDGWITLFFSPVAQPVIFTGYVIDIGPAGIETIKLNNETFILQQNIPNPSIRNTTIEFIAGQNDVIDFKFINLLGESLISKEINAKRGVNTIDIDISSYPNGVYLYSVSNGKKKLTKRMIINH